MQSRSDDANAIFFLQLLLTPPLVFAIASVWHFARGRAWFNGERERPLRAEESGARPITAPLIGGPAAGARQPAFVSSGPALADYAPRAGAYLLDVVLSGALAAALVLVGIARKLGDRRRPGLAAPATPASRAASSSTSATSPTSGATAA